eukprot:5017441-Prymnesium_polylepis.1
MRHGTRTRGDRGQASACNVQAASREALGAGRDKLTCKLTGAQSQRPRSPVGIASGLRLGASE